MAAPITFSVGHTATLGIVYLDQHGNPMLVPPTPDSPPTWAHATPATATLTPSADGMSATEAGVAAGSDSVSLSVTVGGLVFSATLPVTVSAEPQVLRSVDISSTIS